MSATPTVSVCIPSYRAEATIAATIASVRAQTFPDWELVVLDDASDDDTVARAREAAGGDERIRVEVQPANVGAEANWNAVSARARGRYVKLLCSDDLITPGCLAVQVAALDRFPTAALVAGRRDIIGPDGRAVVRHRGLGRLQGLVPGAEAARRLVRSGTNLVGEPSVLLAQREAMEAVGPYHGRHPYLIDVEMTLRLLGRGDLVALPETVGAFRVGPSTWSARLARVQGAQARALFAEVAADPASPVTRLDATIGSARSHVLAPLRRAAFAVAARRAARR